MMWKGVISSLTTAATKKPRNNEIDSTAIGIDAETVMPTFSTRYIDEAEKMMPRIVPTRTEENVNSLTFVVLGGTNGLKPGGGAGIAAADVLVGTAIANQ